MKISVAIATADAPPSAFVVWRGVEESIRKAADCGYDGVELALRSADQVDADEVGRLLDERGLECPCISTGQVFATSGLYFTTRDGGRRTDVIRVFRELIDLAAGFGAMVNVGRARGFVEEGEGPAEAAGRFIEVASELAAHAAARDVRIVVEPVNRYEINFINSVEEAAALVDAVGSPNLGLMPDLFHMNIEDHALGPVLEQHADLIGYIHFADSNRLAPGRGHTDFRAVLTSLKRARYDGWIGVEILPRPDPDTAAGQAIEFLRPLVEEYNRA